MRIAAWESVGFLRVCFLENALSEGHDELAGGELLVEGLGEQAGDVGLADGFGHGDAGGVSRDLIVLDTGRGSNNSGIEQRALLVLFERLLYLGDGALHALAMLGGSLLAQRLKALLQAHDVALGLFEVVEERLLELRAVGSFGGLGEGLDQLIFSAVQVLQFFDQYVT